MAGTPASATPGVGRVPIADASGKLDAGWLPDGALGLSLVGAWSSVTTYAIGDVVTYLGSSYAATAVSTNSTPPSANWQLMASKGDTGAAGADGADGATGPAGPASVTTTLLNAVTATGAGTWHALTDDRYRLRASLVGTGNIDATARIQVSDDQVTIYDLTDLTIIGSNSQSGEHLVGGRYNWIRAIVDSITGTGAALTLTSTTGD